MTGSVNSVSDWKRRLGSVLQRDKKKTVLLVVLLVTAGTIGGRLVVSKVFPAPAEAKAAPKDSRGERLLPDVSTMGRFAPSRLSAPRPDAAARREEYLASLDRTITRDLFRPSPELFPPSGDDPGASRRRAEDPRSGQPSWFRQVGAWVEQARQARRDEAARAKAVRAQAAALDLQSTMVGPSASALINGRVLRKSALINGFRVKSIGADNCVVTKDGVDVVLHMKK
jgi:hypothetical protein